MPNEFAAIGRHAKVMQAIYERINNIHHRPLHQAQIQIAKDYFVRGMRVIMSQWGRSCGKTESALFIATVASILTPGFMTYIITPERKQGKEIYWASGRLPSYPPPEYVSDVRTGEQRLVFTNNSFICVEGCENYDGLRGIKPNLVIYDEFQNHSKEFHLAVMQPNLLAKQSALIIYGTPPKQRSAYYVEFWELLKKSIAEGDCTKVYYEFPTELNPTIDKDELAKTRKELLSSDNEVIWYREYEGKMVFGGEDIVFPKWNPRVHVRTHQVVTSYLEHDRHKIRWYTICDPGTSTCFAVLFAAYNPYTQQVFILDEIYEKDRQRTDTRAIWERIRKKEDELYPNAPERSWKRVYDEAAAWFQREVQANYHVSLIPSQKHNTKEEDDISRIKMLMANSGSLTVSQRCYWLRWEIESYVTDEEGKYPEKNNHLVDCLKYLMQLSGWKLLEKADSDIIASPGGPRALAQKLDIDEWADEVVQTSLEITPNDLYAEYYH
jgi:hypothetical protein